MYSRRVYKHVIATIFEEVRPISHRCCHSKEKQLSYIAQNIVINKMS